MIKAFCGTLISLILVILVWSYGSRASQKAFDQKKWHSSRQANPALNSAPQMLKDLLARHLSLGMSLEQVTNLIGLPETKSSHFGITWIHGGSFEQLVYIYKPALHKNWMIEGTNNLRLYFSSDGQDLQTWQPMWCAVRPVANSQHDDGMLANGQLHISNLKVASTTNQFERLLGPPDERCTEYEFNYYLGKRWRFAWDEVFLELHFDLNRKLTQIYRSEH